MGVFFGCGRVFFWDVRNNATTLREIVGWSWGFWGEAGCWCGAVHAPHIRNVQTCAIRAGIN